MRSSRAMTSWPSIASSSTCSASSCRSAIVAVEARREPPAEQHRLRQRPADVQLVGLANRGPQLRDRAAPAQRPAPDDVGDRDALEVRNELGVRRGNVLPLARVDDEPVDHVDELLEGWAPERRPAAPAQEDRQVGEHERQHDARRCVRQRAVQAQLDHLRAHVALELRERIALERDVRVERVATVRLREEQDRARGMLLGEPGERLARGVLPLRGSPPEVGHHARAEVHRVAAQLRELALDLGDRDVAARPLLLRGAQCRLQERPSRVISSSAPSGPHVPAS